MIFTLIHQERPITNTSSVELLGVRIFDKALDPQESVPLYLVLLTHEARLHILCNVVSHARPVVPPLCKARWST